MHVKIGSVRIESVRIGEDQRQSIARRLKPRWDTAVRRIVGYMRYTRHTAVCCAWAPQIHHLASPGLVSPPNIITTHTSGSTTPRSPFNRMINGRGSGQILADPLDQRTRTRRATKCRPLTGGCWSFQYTKKNICHS